MKEISYIKNENKTILTTNEKPSHILSKDIIKAVRTFHRSFDAYEPTPLQALDSLSERLGIDKLWVKDESYRFGLNAFKVLGGSYAVAKYIGDRLGLKPSELTFEKLKEKSHQKLPQDLTFVTATDGNHGRGIAWAANQLGYDAVVFMPKGSSKIRLENIRKEGAEASITELNYDDTVRLASDYAAKHQGVLIQDSAWEGYEQFPQWIMQGYVTLMDEVFETLDQMNENYPTHVLLQAGVGSFAASMVEYLRITLGDKMPKVIIVEPDEAACIYKSAKINDGQPHNVTGLMPTIMAGLACGEPSILGWPILKDYGDVYLACTDHVAADGMRILGNPLEDDPKIIAGESGAIGMGVLNDILNSNSSNELQKILGLSADARVLMINTEGDTDPQHYQAVVWHGKYSTV